MQINYISSPLLFWAFIFFALPAHAHTLNGYVVSISDGDTITVLDATG